LKGSRVATNHAVHFFFTPLAALESDLDQTLVTGRLKRLHLM
jgi:hypothetical protein